MLYCTWLAIRTTALGRLEFYYACEARSRRAMLDHSCNSRFGNRILDSWRLSKHHAEWLRKSSIAGMPTLFAGFMWSFAFHPILYTPRLTAASTPATRASPRTASHGTALPRQYIACHASDSVGNAYQPCMARFNFTFNMYTEDKVLIPDDHAHWIQRDVVRRSLRRPEICADIADESVGLIPE